MVIIGGGPGGLTAASELLKWGGYCPIVLEADNQVGGISKTINHNGNRIDLGGHRFFSKSDWVMDWWQGVLPISTEDKEIDITYRQKMLVRPRLSRIYYLRKFFDYPVKVNYSTLANLGIWRSFSIVLSYLKSKLHPRNENNLEDVFINRFGYLLYSTFFRDYTEKVWGRRCKEISAEWGVQRIKGLSLTTALKHYLKSFFRFDQSINQKQVETSLIEEFLYPALGPGQLWEEVADRVVKMGGRVYLNTKVVSIKGCQEHISNVTAEVNGQLEIFPADIVISTMPIKDLVESFEFEVPADVYRVASRLPYRDFIIVGVLVPSLNKDNPAFDEDSIGVKDNWIYIQESDVKVARIQIFNNWSPYMVKDETTAWLGMEYFCQEEDELWKMEDDALKNYAINELNRIGFIKETKALDATVVRVPKAYPAYFGEYNNIDIVRTYLDRIRNIYLVGRNGTHKYNNQDHSMLMAKKAVDIIVSGAGSKDDIWSINTEMEYHEKRQR